MSLETVATLTDLSIDFLGQIEHGLSLPSPPVLTTFVNVVSVGIAVLFGAELRTPHRTALSPASASAPS
jgi:hypothetical protein